MAVRESMLDVQGALMGSMLGQKMDNFRPESIYSKGAPGLIAKPD
jgi:hypothetical protein